MRGSVRFRLAVLASCVLAASAAGSASARIGPADPAQLAVAAVDTPTFSQQAYLKTLNSGLSDAVGGAVAISGDTIVVGAIGEDSARTGVNSPLPDDSSAISSGAAYVFVRDNGAWTQQAYLKASNTDAYDGFGRTVAIDGDTIVVGATGEASNATTIGGDETNDTAPAAGAAYVFVRTNGIWTQQAYLKAANAQSGDQFGSSVDVSGDTVVVGAGNEASNGADGESNNSMPGAGAAYVFVRNAGVWSQQAYIKAGNPGQNDRFGEAIAIAGDTLIASAWSEDGSSTGVNGTYDDSAPQAGAAYVFARTGTAWSQQAYLKASNTESEDRFGLSVDVDGDTAIVGAYFEDSNAIGVDGNQTNNLATFAGAAYVFARSGSTWSQQAYLKASNTESVDFFGWDVAVSGDMVVVGATQEDSRATGVGGHELDNSLSAAGAAYVFSRADEVWSHLAYVKPSNPDSDDLFAGSVAIDGTSLVAGAAMEDGNGQTVNAPQTNTGFNSGAAYVFGPPCATAPFSDIETVQPFCAEIEWMKQTGVSTGFGDGTYRPADVVTRQAMSAFMARLAGATLPTCSDAPFSDVQTDHPFCKEIKWMKDEGISNGFDDGTYRPGAVVTRQAMSAFMARLGGATLTICTEMPFTDVPIDHTFCDEITWMKNNGISTGFGDGTYRPGVEVTRQAMSAFMFRLSRLI